MEIIQLKHIITNTVNAEKSISMQHENVAVYHDLATQRMNNMSERNKISPQHIKKSDES